MKAPTPYELSQLISGLVGKPVSFALVLKPAETKTKKIYGVYAEVLTKKAIVVIADLPLLANLGGTFLGLPGDTSLERAQQNPMDEFMRDAIYEILNVTSSSLSTEGRVVFTQFVLDAVLCDGDASDVIQKPDMKNSFNVSIGGQPHGLFTILSRL